MTALLGAIVVLVGPLAWKPFGFAAMVIWIPPAALVVLYFAKPRRRVVTLPTFANHAPFVPHVEACLSFDSPQGPNAAGAGGTLVCVFVIGTEGFSARVRVTDPTSAHQGPAQFLMPMKAVPRFPRGTRFAVLVGNAMRGHGEILDAVEHRTDTETR